MKFTLIEEYLDILGYKSMPSFLKKFLDCPSLVRLKKVCYFCGMDYASSFVYNFLDRVSRYDHSLSVALITWRLTKDKRATLAGLFHDVATPCFSHVIDYMNKDYDRQESTEEKTGEIIINDSYLLSCLEEDGILVDDIVDFKKYSIVDLDRPMLCADRLDGVVLTGLMWTKSININDVRKIIYDMVKVINEDGNEEIGLKSMEVSLLILKTSQLIDIYCHSNEDNYMMELLANITRRAINLNLVSYDELFVLDEDELFLRFDRSGDMELLKDIDLFRNISLDEIPKIDMPPTKIRTLNPLVCGSRLK